MIFTRGKWYYQFRLNHKMKSQERRLKILLLLQARKKTIGIDYLAEYFGVSRRTIFRDLNFISEMEVPIAYDSIDGYSIPKSYNIPPLMFTEKELSVIMIGLSFMKSQSDSSMVEDAKSVQLKIENVVPESLRVLIETLDKHIIVDPFVKRDPKGTISSDWYIISNSISSQHRIQFNYRDRKEIRTLEPYFLVFYSDHWNMLGYDVEKSGFRNFRLEYISDLLPLSESFLRDNKVTHDSIILGESDGLNHVGIFVELEVWNDFVRTFPVELSVVKKEKRGYHCEFNFNSLMNLNRMLLTYGNSVKILFPIELVDIRTQYLNHMLDSYK